MEVRKLHLRNFRGVTVLDLELNPHLNVFVGVNGAGKSSVLDALSVLLSWFTSRVSNPRGSGKPIAEIDIRNGASHAELDIGCDHDGQFVRWALAKSRKGRVSEGRSEFGMLSELTRGIQQAITDTEGAVNVPLLVYYPVHRAVIDIPLRIRQKHSFDLLSAYDEALTSASNFRRFFEWFREREDLENEDLREAIQQHGRQANSSGDPHLNAVRRAISMFMPDFSNLRVRRNPLRMEVNKQGQTLTVSQLSGGEKCLMAMIGDLARRLAIANPALGDPLQGEGVVLIDELDLHLHPQWQRMLIPRLMEVFPRCQFIASTHSPQIITHVQPESLFLIRSVGSEVWVEKPTESYGKSANRVLEDLMGLETTRPTEVSSDLEKVFNFINNGQLDQARGLISQLKTEIGPDPELDRASVLIKRKELIRK
jgi:predicted ATP-binding protein involved in virulence